VKRHIFFSDEDKSFFYTSTLREKILWTLHTMGKISANLIQDHPPYPGQNPFKSQAPPGKLSICLPYLPKDNF
jgi:hypothetical protein